MLRRFFVEKIQETNGLCTISGPEAKHVSKVLRMKSGDRFILMDAQGLRYQVAVKSVLPRQVRVILETRVPEPPPSPLLITLCQALPRSRAMDYLVQKTSELGVDCIIPFFSERTVVKYSTEQIKKKMKHWHEIAISSAKQCDRGSPAIIEPPSFFLELLEKIKSEDALKIIFWEQEGSRDFKSLLKSSGPLKKITGIIGPEGGFSRKEVEAAGDAGFIPVSMGRRILRAETAAISTVAIMQYEFGDLCL